MKLKTQGVLVAFLPQIKKTSGRLVISPLNKNTLVRWEFCMFFKYENKNTGSFGSLSPSKQKTPRSFGNLSSSKQKKNVREFWQPFFLQTKNVRDFWQISPLKQTHTQKKNTSVTSCYARMNECGDMPVMGRNFSYRGSQRNRGV